MLGVTVQLSHPYSKFDSMAAMKNLIFTFLDMHISCICWTPICFNMIIVLKKTSGMVLIIILYVYSKIKYSKMPDSRKVILI